MPVCRACNAVISDARFCDQASELAGLILEAKRLALAEALPANISELIESRLAEVQTKTTNPAS